MRADTGKALNGVPAWQRRIRARGSRELENVRMLDNEPRGGDTSGIEPAAAATPDAAAADSITSTPESTPEARRTRARRANASRDGEAAAGPTGEPAEGTREETGAEPVTVRVTRRSRKTAKTDSAGEIIEGAGEPAGATEVSVSPVAQTRRRRTAAAEPPGAAAESPGAAVEPLGAAVESPGAIGESPGAAGQESEVARTSDRRRAAALSPPAVLFMAPEPPPAPAAPVERGPAEEAAEGARTRRRRGRRTAEVEQPEPVAEPAPVVAEAQAVAAEEGAGEYAGEEHEEEPVRRRRRRGRRGRGRGKGTAEEELAAGPAEAEPTEPSQPAEATETREAAEAAEATETVTRRRRRRRRKGAGAEVEIEVEDDVPTIIKIREPRTGADEVQGVSGSTRLEAKRQRRRDGREQRRTRPPILSEAEFLARRESVDRVMVVRQTGDRTQIAVLEDGVLVEHYVARASASTIAGNVYLGKVQNVLPSMEAAFIDIGRGRNAVLYAGEVNWDATGLEGKARSIEHALKPGDSVLVQVTKDPVGHKGARLTSHIALSGRHLVYVPNGNASGISRKLPDTERRRLREVLKKLVPEGAGVIVRTAAEGATEDELARDVKRLQAQWEDILAKASSVTAPALLYEEPDLLIRVVRDLFNEDFRELVVQGEEAYETVEAYLAHVSPDLVSRLRRHTGVQDVFADKRIDEQILKGLDRKVYLPSGGHLVIDRTEAMTVIDVNTGKYIGTGGNLEETVTRNNLEAAEEIVRQLRLRDVGGIIVIDFIDMVLESNRELVLRRLTECLGRDRTKHQVTEITSLGLVQMTRKRIGQGLLEAFSETCEVCKGRGVIIHTEPTHDRAKTAEKVKAVAAGKVDGAARRRGRRAVAASAEPEPQRPEPAAEGDTPAAVVDPQAALADVGTQVADDELPDPETLTGTLDESYEPAGLDATGP